MSLLMDGRDWKNGFLVACSLGGDIQQTTESPGLENGVGWRQKKGGTGHGMTLDTQAQGERPVERDSGDGEHLGNLQIPRSKQGKPVWSKPAIQPGVGCGAHL